MKRSLIKRLKLKTTLELHIMFLLPLIILLIFKYWPMVGSVLAFQNFKPKFGYFGSPWVGWANFQKLFSMNGAVRSITNTVIISVAKITSRLVISMLIALGLHEIRCIWFKRVYQSAALFPYFLSWVVLGNIFLDVFSTSGAWGAVTNLLGISQESILMNPNQFRIILIATSDWKGYGYELAIIIAALANIDPTYYEAADIDGASRFQKMRYLTVPNILPTAMMLLILSLSDILNAGFEQILVMYNKTVFSTSDVIDTFVYRLTFESAQYSLATAAGLFKSVIGLILVITSNKLAERYGNYQIL